MAWNETGLRIESICHPVLNEGSNLEFSATVIFLVTYFTCVTFIQVTQQNQFSYCNMANLECAVSIDRIIVKDSIKTWFFILLCTGLKQYVVICSENM